MKKLMGLTVLALTLVSCGYESEQTPPLLIAEIVHEVSDINARLRSIEYEGFVTGHDISNYILQKCIKGKLYSQIDEAIYKDTKEKCVVIENKEVVTE